MKKLHWRYLVSSLFMLGAIQVAVAADFDPLQPLAINLSEENTDSPAQLREENGEDSESNRPQSKPSVIRAMVESILQQLRREEPPLGSRNNLCAIAPGLLGETDTVWHLRPWFWWEGEAQEIVLSDYNTNQPIWSASVASMQSVQYTGDSLEPGQVYIWEIVRTDGSSDRYTFAIMSQAQRDRIQQQLDSLKDSGHDTEISLAQAQFFGDRGLWSDALQSLNQVVDTPEIQGLQQQIKSYLCSSKMVSEK